MLLSINFYLDIAEGGLNTMLTMYKTALPTLGGYLVEDANIQWERVEKFLVSIQILHIFSIIW